jgi:wobble nucleotide-excising tRNase
MGDLVNFQEFKKKREEAEVIRGIQFEKPERRSACPFCQAPTLVEETGTGTEIHTYCGVDMDAYQKLRTLLDNIVNYFKTSEDGVADDDLIAAFGEGMEEFLKEQEHGS